MFGSDFCFNLWWNGDSSSLNKPDSVTNVAADNEIHAFCFMISMLEQNFVIVFSLLLIVINFWRFRKANKKKFLNLWDIKKFCNHSLWWAWNVVTFGTFLKSGMKHWIFQMFLKTLWKLNIWYKIYHESLEKVNLQFDFLPHIFC